MYETELPKDARSGRVRGWCGGAPMPRRRALAVLRSSRGDAVPPSRSWALVVGRGAERTRGGGRDRIQLRAGQFRDGDLDESHWRPKGGGGRHSSREFMRQLARRSASIRGADPPILISRRSTLRCGRGLGFPRARAVLCVSQESRRSANLISPNGEDDPRPHLERLARCGSTSAIRPSGDHGFDIYCPFDADSASRDGCRVGCEVRVGYE